MSDNRIDALRAKARALSDEPGIYLMRDKGGDIIYVGKAKRLKNRVSGYFSVAGRHAPKVLSMVERVWDFDVIVTSDEFEALVLECSLIKLHLPKYNILLKDDKGYSYLRADLQSDYPRIAPAKQKAEDGALYLGPYMSAWVVRQTADEANKTFGLASCRRVFPRDFKRYRPCLNFHMGLCMGVCRGHITPGEYKQSVEMALDFIKSGAAATKKELTQRMEVAAEQLDFEAAARFRDRLRALEGFAERQRLVYAGVADQDVLAFVQAGELIALCLLRFRGEMLVDKLDFLFEDFDERSQLRREFILRYYNDNTRELPPLITVDGDVEERAEIEEFLSRRSGRRVRINCPSRGERLRLIETAQKNAAQALAGQKGGNNPKELATLDRLGELLGLASPPRRIEAYDISNIGSEVVVGAMAVFINGRHSKKDGRKFLIKGFETPDDYSAMRQVLMRRLKRGLDGDGAFLPMPDLIFVDGGQAHAGTAKQVTESMGVDVPVFGLVKDDRHRTRAVAGGGGEISVSAVRNVFTLVSTIQETVHKNAVEYARATHKRSAFETELTRVPGIGPKRARALFLHFKTKKAILNANTKQLESVAGMTKTAAQELARAVARGDIG
jgi:excinuclease ABC subunit C